MITRAPHRTLAIFAMVGGGLLGLLSVCALVSYLGTPLIQPELGLLANTAVLSLGAVGAVFGALLLGIGRSLRRGNASPALSLPSPLVFLGAFIAVLLAGQAILIWGLGGVYVFPPFHILGSLLVPLVFLSFAVRRLRPVSRRSMFGQFVWGGLVTIALALVFEILIGGALVVLAVIAAALVIGSDRITELASVLQSSIGNPEQAIRLLSAEPLVLIIAALTAVVLFVVIVPLLEEMLKACGPALVISRRDRARATPSKSEVLLWGLAAGAGYAFTENIFNAQGAISGGEGTVNFWAAAMLLRSGTSLMHMAATATVAVGWYHWLVARKRSRFLLLLALAAIAHATWNTGALVLGGVAALSGLDENLAVLAGCVAGLALVFLIGLFGAFVYWLVRLIRWGQPPPVEIITSSGTLLEIKG